MQVAGFRADRTVAIRHRQDFRRYDFEPNTPAMTTASDQSTTGDSKATPAIMKIVQNAGDHLSQGATSPSLASLRLQNPCASSRFRTVGLTAMVSTPFASRMLA